MSRGGRDCFHLKSKEGKQHRPRFREREWWLEAAPRRKKRYWNRTEIRKASIEDEKFVARERQIESLGDKVPFQSRYNGEEECLLMQN